MKKNKLNKLRNQHPKQHDPFLILLLATNDVSGLAYHLYERDGRPDGKDLEHWFNAESMIENNFGYGRDHSEPSFSETTQGCK